MKMYFSHVLRKMPYHVVSPIGSKAVEESAWKPAAIADDVARAKGEHVDVTVLCSPA